MLAPVSVGRRGLGRADFCFACPSGLDHHGARGIVDRGDALGGDIGGGGGEPCSSGRELLARDLRRELDAREPENELARSAVCRNDDDHTGKPATTRRPRLRARRPPAARRAIPRAAVRGVRREPQPGHELALHDVCRGEGGVPEHCLRRCARGRQLRRHRPELEDRPRTRPTTSSPACTRSGRASSHRSFRRTTTRFVGAPGAILDGRNLNDVRVHAARDGRQDRVLGDPSFRVAAPSRVS